MNTPECSLSLSPSHPSLTHTLQIRCTAQAFHLLEPSVTISKKCNAKQSGSSFLNCDWEIPSLNYFNLKTNTTSSFQHLLSGDSKVLESTSCQSSLAITSFSHKTLHSEQESPLLSGAGALEGAMFIVLFLRKDHLIFPFLAMTELLNARIKDD